MSAAAASPAKKVTKTKAVAKPASHPTYSAMIKAAVKALAEKSGSSRAAILKYILANYKVGNNIKLVNAHLRQSLKSGVKKGLLRQVKGTGASGSFKLGEQAKKVVKAPKAKAAKKPKPAPKKSASPKKAAAKPKKSPAKKSPKKVTKPKSPKKTKPVKKASPAKKAVKPKVAKKSPKKTTKKAVKA